MKITHFGHACLLVEIGDTRILFDPGTLSGGFESLRDLDAVLITHDHDDHLDVPRLEALLAGNPEAVVVCDSGSAARLVDAKVVSQGDSFEISGVAVDVVGGAHAFVYLTVPDIPNVAYLLGDGAFFHPGDSFASPGREVDVLALPTSGPWLKVSDAIEYVGALNPRIAVPMHEAALSNTDTHYGLIGAFVPEGTTFVPLEHGVPTDL